MRLIDYINKIRESVKQIGVTEVSKLAGLEYNTVNRFVLMGNTTAKTLVALDDALAKLEQAK